MGMSKGEQDKDGADKCGRMGEDVGEIAAAGEGGNGEHVGDENLRHAQENILSIPPGERSRRRSVRSKPSISNTASTRFHQRLLLLLPLLCSLRHR
jgi:hypothetical protein